jgi:hypothetical protein
MPLERPRSDPHVDRCSRRIARRALLAWSALLLTASCGQAAVEPTSPPDVAAGPAELAPERAGAGGGAPQLFAAAIDRALLQPAELRYAVRFEMGGQAVDGTMQRSVRREQRGEREVWSVSTETDLGSGSRDLFLLDATTLAPLRREAQDDRSRLTLEFSERAIEGSMVVGESETPISVAIESAVMGDTSALEWLVTAWRLTPGSAVTVRAFDARARRVRPITFEVIAVEPVTVPAGTFDAYKVRMSSGDGASGTSTLWLAQDAPRHLLRSETVLPAAAIRAELVSAAGG